MINPLAIVTLGLGFDSLSKATIGFVTQAAEIFYPYFGAAGDYRHEDKRKPKPRIVKKAIKEVAKELLPKKKIIPKYYTETIDINRISALIQYDTMVQAREYIRNEIERKIRQEQDEEDFLMLMLL